MLEEKEIKKITDLAKVDFIFKKKGIKPLVCRYKIEDNNLDIYKFYKKEVYLKSVVNYIKRYIENKTNIWISNIKVIPNNIVQDYDAHMVLIFFETNKN